MVLHGGAGTIDAETVEKKYNGTKAAARAAYEVLVDQGGSALDAVVACIKACPNFFEHAIHAWLY